MTKNLSIRLFSSLAITLLLCVGQILAQAGQGSITGVVTDSNGAVIPNATVKLVSTERGTETTTTASGDGIYTFTSLLPGKYTVSASGGSFAEQKLDVEVQVGRTTDANFTLGASGVAEQVTVTAEGVAATQSNSDAVLSETAIANLPINGRRFQDFATLTPTAQVDTERNQISLSGQRGVNANINVDGVDYNQPFFGGIRGGERSNFAPTIPQESIKEFNVVAAGYNAEFGRSTGGVINVVTKAGTNDYRGSLFYLVRPDKFSRNHKFVKRLEEVNNLDITAAPTQTQWGGGVGGPIVRDRLFFFGSYEQQKFEADRFVLFTGLSSTTNVPTVDNTNSQAVNFFRSLETPYKLTNDAQTALGRIDWNVNSANSANFRFSWNAGEGQNSVSVGDAGVLFNPVSNSALSQEGTEKDRNYVFVSQLNTIFSSSYINDFRFQYARGERPRESNSRSPNVFVFNIGSYGTRSFLPTTQSDNRIQFVDGFSIIKGNHNIKIGGEFSDIFVEQLFGFNQFGAYSFGGSTNSILQTLSLNPTDPTDRRFDTTSTTYRQQIGNLEAAFHIKELAFYAQDQWRISKRFTVNFGLRMEKQYNPSPELGNASLVNAVRNASFPLLGGRGFDPSVIPDSEWQFGPRLGFAWDMNADGKSVLRGFAGMYYARTPALLIAGPFNNFRTPPGDVSVSLPFSTNTLSATTPAGVTAYNAFLAANPSYVTFLGTFGIACPAVVNPTDTRNCVPNTVFRQFALVGVNANSAALDALPTLSPGQINQLTTILGAGFPQVDLIGMTPDYKNPQSFQFGFGYEREIANGVVLGADYSYVRTTHLQRNHDINLPVPNAANCTGNTALRPCFNRNNRPLTSIGRILLRESTANSLFEAFTLRTRINRRWGNINAYYVLSNSKSDDDNERNATALLYEDAFNFRPEWGPARLDRRHQFVASPVFFLPMGFEVSSAIRLRSGIPIDAMVGADRNLDSVNNDRPYLAPGGPIRRNAFRNRPEYGVDIRGQKGFGLGENRRLIFSAEIFNLFNNANIQIAGAQTNYCSSTTNNINCGLDGVTNPLFLAIRDSSGNLITSGNFSRTPVFQMQFGARFQF